MTNKCTHRAIRSWCTVNGQPVDMWTCVDCGWMFDPRSDTTEHSTNRSADSAESFHIDESWLHPEELEKKVARNIKNLNKAADTRQSPTEAEPVAWMHTNAVGERYFRKKPHDAVFNPQPVYLRPEPLTDEEILSLLQKLDPQTRRLSEGVRAFARAIERAHGIGGEE